MFPKVAPKYFKERANGPVDAASSFAKKESSVSANGSYTINVNGTSYAVTASGSGDNMNLNVNGTAYNVTFGAAGAAPAVAAAGSAAVSTGGVDIKAPVAGTVLKIIAQWQT